MEQYSYPFLVGYMYRKKNNSELTIDSMINYIFVVSWPRWLAQSDARLTGDQVACLGLITARSSNILSWTLVMKYFLWSSSSFR